MKDKFPLVEVEWIDAESCYADGLSLEEIKEHGGVPATTVGLLIRQDKKEVVVAMTHFHETRTSGEVFKFTFAIPRGCVKSITYLVSQ